MVLIPADLHLIKLLLQMLRMLLLLHMPLLRIRVDVLDVSAGLAGLACVAELDAGGICEFPLLILIRFLCRRLLLRWIGQCGEDLLFLLRAKFIVGQSTRHLGVESFQHLLNDVGVEVLVVSLLRLLMQCLSVPEYFFDHFRF